MPIKTVSNREKLKPRREPYWHPIANGQHLGYRRSKSKGSWIARAYDPATQRRVYKALPESGALPGSMQFDDASRRAREWFSHMAMGGAAESITVWQACERYVEHVRRKKGERAAEDAQHRLQRDVRDQPISSIEINKLAARHVEQWREYMADRPAKRPLRGRKFGEQPNRRGAAKSAATINRDLVPFRAALNLAKAQRFVVTDAAWSQSLKPIEGADNKRKLYLDRAQRQALIAELKLPELAVFVRALCLLPLRPGAIAALRVSNFEQRNSTLTVQHDKAKKGREFLLPTMTAELFKAQCRDKLPGALIFSRFGGDAWTKDSWKKPIKAAADAAGLPGDTTLYTIRHSVITDLVTGGLDIFTVAQLAGTSVLMIEKHYGHLRQTHARDALEQLSL